jgi:hypothetical protein
MHMSQSLFYLTTALHVSGVTTTHLQEHKTTVTTESGNRYTVIELNLLIKSTNRLVYRYSLSGNLTLSITV